MIDLLNEKCESIVSKLKEVQAIYKYDSVLSDSLEEVIDLVNDSRTDLKTEYVFNLTEEVDSEIQSRDLVEKVELNQYLNEYFTTSADLKCIQDDLPNVLLKIWNTRNRLITIDVEFLDRIADELNSDVELYKKIYKLID